MASPLPPDRGGTSKITQQHYHYFIVSCKTKPKRSAQLFPKRFPVSDRADPYIPHRKSSKHLHHGGDVCGIVVLGSMVLSILFPP